MLNKNETSIVDKVLLYEHERTALKLKFIDDLSYDITDTVLEEACGLIDRLSKNKDEKSRKIIVTLSSILWTYQKSHWTGLNSFLIRILSSVGYSPSSIMMDKNYDHEENRYSEVASIFDQLAITLEHLKCEVVLNNKVFLLTQFQKKIWDKVDLNKALGVSAPTSAGKSFVLGLKAIDLLIKADGNIVYIVPTLSLVSQVSIDFRKLLDLFGLGEYEILNAYDSAGLNEKKIFVLTQEKAIGAFSQDVSPFRNVRMLVADEIQNVERVYEVDDQRAKTLYDLLIEFRHSPEIDNFVISGPRIEGIGNLCDSLFDAGNAEEKDRSSPVSSFTYSIHSVGKNYFFKQHVDIKEEPHVIEIAQELTMPRSQGKMYNDKYHNFMGEFIASLGEGSMNIIFSPTSPQARKTAIALAGKSNDNAQVRLNSLIDYLSETVHPKYHLCETLKKGFAYHHGKIPHHVRRAIEKAVSEKLINNVVCTTTLMQGVNLPAQNVIIRNPNLYTKGGEGAPALTQYEISNLRGRAGRLLKDFIGRTFILDENAFLIEDATSPSVFEDQYKSIKSGYGAKFQEYEGLITSDLLNNNSLNIENQEYSFLSSYVRQMILRHQDEALLRFKSVGINISDSNFRQIKANLKELKTPLEVLAQNRYWDPFDIEKIYQNINSYSLPSSITEYNLANKLQRLIEQLKRDLPLYVARYFNVPEALLQSTCISSEDWMKEKTLKEILSSSYYNDDAEKIEKAIDRLQNKVSYGLPLLLKPLYNIMLPESGLLSCIEVGAFRPITKKLISYNIPRETAIYLNDNLFSQFDIDAESSDRELKDIIKTQFDSLDYWVQIQLEAIISIN